MHFRRERGLETETAPEANREEDNCPPVRMALQRKARQEPCAPIELDEPLQDGVVSLHEAVVKMLRTL